MRHWSSVSAEEVLVPHLPRHAAVSTTAARAATFLSAAKTLTSLQTSSPLSPAPISAMSTTWPSLKSLNCLVL